MGLKEKKKVGKNANNPRLTILPTLAISVDHGAEFADHANSANSQNVAKSCLSAVLAWNSEFCEPTAPACASIFNKA